MSTHNAANLSVQSVDTAAKAVARCESHTEYCDFKTFHIVQVVVFKNYLAEAPVSSRGSH
jgi:hypothetical protein